MLAASTVIAALSTTIADKLHGRCGVANRLAQTHIRTNSPPLVAEPRMHKPSGPCNRSAFASKRWLRMVRTQTRIPSIGSVFVRTTLGPMQVQLSSGRAMHHVLPLHTQAPGATNASAAAPPTRRSARSCGRLPWNNIFDESLHCRWPLLHTANPTRAGPKSPLQATWRRQACTNPSWTTPGTSAKFHSPHTCRSGHEQNISWIRKHGTYIKARGTHHTDPMLRRARGAISSTTHAKPTDQVGICRADNAGCDASAWVAADAYKTKCTR